jgi:hemoglobin
MSTTLDADDIVRLVDRFYTRVQADPVLGPIFNAAVDDWDEHKRLLVSFWSSIALGTRSYRGNPMAMHRPHPIREEHFAHWLALWREVAEAELSAEHAAMVIEHANRIAQSLQFGLGLAPRRGIIRGLPVIGERGDGGDNGG